MRLSPPAERKRRIDLNRRRRLYQYVAALKRKLRLIDQQLQREGDSLEGLLERMPADDQRELTEHRERLAWRGEHIHRLMQDGHCGECGYCRGVLKEVTT
jgi:hypothetical protein